MRLLLLLSLLGLLTVMPAAAQDRPFVFSVSTAPSDRSHATIHVDSSVGGAFDVIDSEHPVQRFGVQASLGDRLTLIAKVGFTSDEHDVGTMQEGEVLYSVLRAPAARGSVAVGLGLRHEVGGTNVLMGRAAAGRSFSAWRVDGNALFEKPFVAGRDALDLIVSAGLARQVTPAFHAGVELIGEDLEGFWEANEAEGGARMLVGPSIRFAPTSAHWQMSAAGGPLLYATRSGLASEAARALPRASGRNGFAVRASFSYTF